MRFDFFTYCLNLGLPPLTAARVVGILQRTGRDYVVTFPPWEEVQSQSRNSQRILVTPWDRRIPKIRISTQRAEALQVRDIFAPLDADCLNMEHVLCS